MKRDELGDLVAFLAVAEEQSFTRAAARLGTSQSSLSHTVRRLEERLGVRLLTRTTRKVSPTAAGEQLAETLRPAFDDIKGRLSSINALRERPAGLIRITSSKYVADRILMPVVLRLMREYPEVNIEIAIDQRLTDIVAERFDAGVRFGEMVEKDMVAVRIGPEISMAVVGSPEYFERHAQPKTPYELIEHRCINFRMPTMGGLYVWEFEQNGRPLNIRVDGQFVCNDGDMIIAAAKAGIGLAALPADLLEEQSGDGELVRVLEDWCPPFPGYHLYYPSRRQITPAFELLVDALRYRG
ncbi:LysR family transcriptional regulator [Roseibium limicola]|uniref:LysR family transcriptional regulator n=1 Tax=Roseibium limicola TaxID=2816037 RepID=A0A939EK29_9HYPH|nr:LysR family transcriptional regulator [Roseibium limicola]MBO0344095.1 LysR family transcriptional regulator [Roseibium limicola]